MDLRIRHYAKMLLRPDYRKEQKELSRLRSLPRFKPGRTGLLGPELQYVDSASALSMYGEIFDRQIYRFKSGNKAPVIIDGGANIGMSVIYFKRLFPDSEVTAFEPDPPIFKALSQNIAAFGLQGVSLVNKALWSSETVLEFMHEGADGGRVDELQKGYATVKVPTVRLSDYLQQDVDFLKIDIEGAETEVLLSCSDSLSRVRNLFVEYHSFTSRDQTLHLILEVMNKAGFRYMIQQIPNGAQQPFFQRYENLGMDMQLNIFAYRDTAHG